MDDCILWTGGAHYTGYGYIVVNRKIVRAHRWVWEQERGPIPEGMVIRHACDTRLCVNIEHLLLGTQADNVADMIERGRDRTGRQKTHCLNNHEYTEENTYINKRGHRHCRECAREREKRRVRRSGGAGSGLE